MGRRISEMDWSDTLLGPTRGWPQSLKTAVSILLTSRYPMFIWWGEDLLNLYNDAYIPVLGARHPEALGRPASEVWHEIWDDVGQQAKFVVDEAQSIFQERRLLLTERNEYTEETYFTYSYSPLRDDSGEVGGVFCTCLEETQRVLYERRLHVLRQISEVAAVASSLDEAGRRIAGVLRSAGRDVSFALLYEIDERASEYRLVADTGVGPDPELAPDRLPLDGSGDGLWNFERAAGRPPLTVQLDPELDLPGGAWPEPATSARVLPLTSTPEGNATFLLIAGLSPRRQMDEDYARFFDLLASTVAGALSNVRAYEIEQRTLRESEERFRTLANSMPQLAWMARPDGQVFWFNRRWYEYTGVAPDGVEDRDWSSVLDPDELPRVREHYEASIASGTPWEDTFRLRRHDGEMRWHLSRALPVRDESGEIVLWFGTNTDITERREMEQALRDADRRKDQFLAALAHELRNPLAPLSHGLEMLGMTTDSAAAEKVRLSMERQLENIVRLVDDLLDVSRVSLRKVQLKRERVSLSLVLDHAIETARSAIVAREHELEYERPDEGLVLFGDRTRLEQVFANLLHNAAKYTPRGGRIRVETEADDTEVRVAVADDGIGIAEEDRARIFELFAQKAEPGYGDSGLGVGLTVVRHLVDHHQGSVSVESAGPDQGSRFTVTLPLAPAPEPEVAAAAADGESLPPEAGGVEPAANGGGRAPSRRVLVVDDNRNAAEMLVLLLETLGHEVAVAADGHEALERGEAFRPEVVFLDIGLPRLDGYETCRLIRQRDWGREIRIAAVTGWGQDEDRRRSEEAGFDDHLVKPVNPGLLKEMLA
jgi:PAS domain S-box-containing protein